MLGLSGSLRVFLAVEPVDLRKSFNGLHGVVLDRLKVLNFKTAEELFALEQAA